MCIYSNSVSEWEVPLWPEALLLIQANNEQSEWVCKFQVCDCKNRFVLYWCSVQAHLCTYRNQGQFVVSSHRVWRTRTIGAWDTSSLKWDVEIVVLEIWYPWRASLLCDPENFLGYWENPSVYFTSGHVEVTRPPVGSINLLCRVNGLYSWTCTNAHC